MRRLAIERLEFESSDDVFEVGFGGGQLLADLVERTAGRVCGIDISTAMVERARRRLAKRVELIEASAERLPLAGLSFDRAVSLNSLYFWPDPFGAFRELARVLRPGGRLVIGFEPPEELAKWEGSRFGFRAYSVIQVEEMLRAAGFTGFQLAEGRGRRPDRFLILSAVRAHANG